MIKEIKKESKEEEEVIKETDESKIVFQIKTSELVKIISENYLISGEFESTEVVDFETFGKKYNIPKIICANLKVKNYIYYKEILYNDIKLLQKPATVEFIDKDGNRFINKFYYIENIKKKIDELHFENPVIIKHKKQYPYSSLSTILDSSELEFQIQENEEINYEKIFDKKIIHRNYNYKNYLDLTENFEYYFKYPKPEDEFILISSKDRALFFAREFKNRIEGICGPMGIGKSTTLLVLLKVKGNYCYLNIKALKDNEKKIFIWKNKLLLREIAYALNNNQYKFTIFEDLQKKICEYSSFWEAIKATIEYFIEKQIKINFIFDQYQEKNDPNYKYINEIKKMLENDDKKILNIIVSSSINDKDVRNAILSRILDDEQKLAIYYEYLKSLIDITNHIEKDSKLTEKQKNMIVKDFNSIPKFYFAIRTITDEKKLDEYKILQIGKIKKSINDFFSENDKLSIRENIETLTKLRGTFGYSLEKNDFINLLKILPFKYFAFDFSKNIIDFSFPLVKDVFDNYLTNIICQFLQSPISTFKSGTIGDILELNLINDLSNKVFFKIDLTVIVNSIWSIMTVKPTKTVKDYKSILFIQDNQEAKYIDFAILNDSEDLLLFQCKKALKIIPENYITRKIIENNKYYLYNRFNEHFGVKLKNIFLYYITGIIFVRKDNNFQTKTWGVNEEENFDKIKNIAENAESELLYYDVMNKKIYLEKDGNYESINDIKDYYKKISSPVIIELQKDADNYNDNNNFGILINEYYEDVGKFSTKLSIENDFFTLSQKSYLRKNNLDIYNNEIIACIKNPIERDLSNKRMIGLKRKNKNYLLIEKWNKVIDVQKKSDNSKEKTGKKSLEKGKEEKKKEKKRVIVLVNDNGFKEQTIEPSFYDEIDFAYVFKKNVILDNI